MGSVPPELSLEFIPTFVPKTIISFLKELSLIGNVPERISKLDAFVKRLEEEMRKIDAFKCELPLCMLLLNDAIAAFKEELVQCLPRNVEPVFWNTVDDDYYRSVDRKLDTKLRNIGDSSQSCKNRGGATSLMPFKANLGFAVKKEEREEIPLTLLTPGIKNPRDESCSTGSMTSCSKAVSSSAPNARSSFRSVLQPLSQKHQQQTARKQRRCWSPELHCRFVNALQQLGGSQVATPKQIRELMRVDDLTNDEVKSHLQKYRLHTRRFPASTTSPAKQSVVVSGSGLWMSQDQYGESSKGSSSQSGSPQGPLELAIDTGGNSTPGGDNMEDDEDAKSESYSCKGHIRKPGKHDV
ncbi:transcription factor HHO6-like [Hibiscus syriacus]|uniref:transcription factor HHO6-like n=1 Tax=Hibiscus syriacus TaxID=106335 RepID=UPI001921CAD1|nr:transcription factor HHO6-like [Hibiscus syriacus]